MTKLSGLSRPARRPAKRSGVTSKTARTDELRRLAALPDDAIDTSDIAEITDWSDAEIGKFYRPVKQQVTLRIDADVLAWFKAHDGKYQTEINRALRAYVARQVRKKMPASAGR